MKITADQLAKRIGASVRGDGSKQLIGCAGLGDAGPEHISFVANPKYLRALTDTRAAAVLVSARDERYAPEDLTLLIADDPYFAFREAVVVLHGFRIQPKPGISDQAVVAPDATVDPSCSIQPFVYIAPGAKVGAGSVIYPNCFVGPNAMIGRDCVLYPNVTVYNDCHLGDRVTLHAGCVIGQDGFGYATHQGKHHKIPQIGNVVIEDDVEMGAACTIDRATVGSTRIGQGSKFSDLIAIGHGTTIGKHNLLVAQVGIAGSTQTGDYVVIGGQAGIAGHIKLGDQVQIAAKSGVIDDLPDAGPYGGAPAMPMHQARRSLLAMGRLPELLQDFRKLQKRVTELEAKTEQDIAVNTSG